MCRWTRFAKEGSVLSVWFKATPFALHSVVKWGLHVGPRRPGSQQGPAHSSCPPVRERYIRKGENMHMHTARCHAAGISKSETKTIL